MRNVSLLLAAFVLAAISAYGGEGKIRRSERRIAGRYIVMLQPGTDVDAFGKAARVSHGARVRHAFKHGIKALSLDVSETEALALSRDARVSFVEEDSVVSATSAWGLDRIDQRALPLDGAYSHDRSGAGVTVYIVDTGIFADHEEFAGRVASGFSSVPGDAGTADCNGHGTHVAGIAAGSSYGVAKAATLVPVRVLDCNGSGSASSVIAGLEWILERHTASPRPSVVNLSLGGGASSAVDKAVEMLVATGITTVVAGGNFNQDACFTSPARVPAAITVGATTETDARAAFSNYGTCVDLFAPGTNIMSAWYASAAGTVTSSGTSASAPFVSGVAALWIEAYPDASPGSVAQTITSNATGDAISAIGDGSPNLLLFSRVGTLDETVSPSGEEQLLADPSFEYGMTFWTSEICSAIRPTGCLNPDLEEYNPTSFAARTGKANASIGGPAKNFMISSEPISVPASITRAELSAYLWVITKNKKSSVADVLTIEIRDAGGMLLQTLGTFSNLDASPTYVRRAFDVSAFRGKTIRIVFSGVQTQGPPTYFLLDDAALNVWH